MLEALQSAKSNLRKVTANSSAPLSEITRANDSTDTDHIRAVTGIHTDEGRVAYFLDGGIDAWYDELKNGLESKGKAIDDVTFLTTLVSLTRDEKEALHSMFREIFADMVSVEDASCAAHRTVQHESYEKQDYFVLLQERVSQMREKIRSECLESNRLSSLSCRLETVICEQHGKAAFVKLTTRSPKDSYYAICEARRALQAKKLSLDCNQGNVDNHNQLWVAFAESLRLQQCVTSGETALLLLATSHRVHEDLTTDLFDNPRGKQSDQIQLSVRTFDVAVAPHTEFRGFVWDRKFVCCGQYFHQLHFPEFQDSAITRQIALDLRRFYDEKIVHGIPEFLSKCPCFMMDLVWKQNEGNGNEASSMVMLTEINPFDGEAIGVFPASTGLFTWDDVAGDRQLMLGKRADFELRVRKELLITSKNLKSHPDLKNLSPLWKCAIYG
eukprot:gnl/MRDRNA2_/MRDRNA2_40950_c0_seq1.p1 gnl/MRDRNA2_/MRDRNA2_40950_c0~~gnl/MRDRNA2_/MRDRNA2_40950_c0_seq1.p1  ORF type:complete len:442 (-),score=80.29 gnl/MRDRNA2_/MRDRNA2_40950_c0_seq1:156-1481(-)